MSEQQQQKQAQQKGQQTQKQAKEQPNYKHTMNLPKTSFKMKAGLAQHEPERLARWDAADLYRKVLEQNRDGRPFILHDGPPYANGPIHIGHALNKILKDIIVKYRSMRGYFAPYVPGWDCHGLPIENKVEDELGPEKMAKIPTSTFRKICREYAQKQLEGQKKGFKRLGVCGEWDNPYLTFTPEYEAGNIEVFKKLYLSGAIYQGRKPIHWCTHCHTALAEAELEYSDEVSPAIYVRFELTSTPDGLEAFADKVDVAIWTTTPWTLPANQAVILHPEANYVAVEHDGRAIIFAESLAQKCCEKFGWEATLAKDGFGHTWKCAGKDLAGNTYKQPIFADLGEAGKFIYADYVTLEDGTGIVHSAPGHGVDDYLAGQEFGIPIVMPVDDSGHFYGEHHGGAAGCGCAEGGAGAGQEGGAGQGATQEGAGQGTGGLGLGTGGPFAGLEVNEANPKIIEWLKERGALLLHEDISHSYPHCWRCKNPVIFRATTQWFVSMDRTDLRENAMNEIENNVEFIPAWASNRIGSMVQDRPDWCISRQRYWGVPIPVFTCKDCGQVIACEESFDAVIELFKDKGADAWYTTEPSDILPDSIVCPDCGGRNFEAGKDVLDVWWESGVSHTSVCEARPYLHRPADLYLEGSDQHRGWFQSSLLTSVGAYGAAPYKAVLSCGFTVDEQGHKMSKSLGNVIDPNEVCKTLGADVLRLWVASVDYAHDVSVSDEILKRSSEGYRRIRNTFRYLLGSLNDFTTSDYVAADELLEFDAWALARLQNLVQTSTKAYDEYNFHAVYRAWYDFISSTSAVYFEAIKDRLYSDAADCTRRRSAQTVLANMLEAMVRQLAPILTFTCDEVWEKYPDGLKGAAGSCGCGCGSAGESAGADGADKTGDGAGGGNANESSNFPKFVQLAGWLEPQDFVPQINGEHTAELIANYEVVMAARDAVMQAIEQMRTDGSDVTKSQAVSVVLHCVPEKAAVLQGRTPECLAEIFIVSAVEVLEDASAATNEDDTPNASGMFAEIKPADGEKCPRCWNYRQLGEDGLCERCHDVVAAFEQQEQQA